MMRTISLSVSLLVLFGFWMACEPPVVFTAPQPKDVAAISKIPEAYHGTYWCEKDSITLVVNAYQIYNKKIFKTAVSQREIKANAELQFENNQLYIKSLKEYFPATKRNDTVYTSLSLKDTILAIDNPLYVLKNFKGHLIVNKKLEDGFWEVKIITLSDDGKLRVSKVNYPENLADLDSITQVTVVDDDIREQIVVSPTQTEFSQILNKKLIFDGDCQVFVPIIFSDSIKEKQP